MKIKTKKQMNLPQLIEWAWENPLLSYGKLYKKDDKEFGDYISFDHQTNEVRVCGKIDCDDLFTVEVEEEITEDTKFVEILLIVNDGLGVEVFFNYSINDVLSNNEGYYEETLMFLLKPEPMIIWTKEKGLVE